MFQKKLPPVFSGSNPTFFCPEKWRQEVPPNRWYFYTKLNGITSQNSVVTYRCKDIKSHILHRCTFYGIHWL